MKGTHITTEIQLLRNDGDVLDLDLCSLDVYEIHIFNNGQTDLILLPPGLEAGGGVGSKQPNGIRLCGDANGCGQNLRLFAGTKFPRADRYTSSFIGGGRGNISVLLYGVKRNL